MKGQRIGVIGGSGLYDMDGLEEVREERIDTPFGPPSDNYVIGRIHQREVVFLPRHGCGHRLMPTEINYRANIFGMKKLGVCWIISMSAVGSLREKYKPLDIVIVDQFFDRTSKRPSTFFGDGLVVHIAFAEPVCGTLAGILYDAGREIGASVHRGGTYVNMEGPAFSTRAESFTNRKLGHDVIGMTNLGEAKCAREAEIAYATMAMITDYDCWKEDEAHVTVEMVIANLMKNAAMAKAIIARLLPQIPAQPSWPCHDALKNAIMTDRKCWPAKTIKELEPILRKYL